MPRTTTPAARPFAPALLYVIQNPAGTFSFVGSVPTDLLEKVPATRSDVMGLRAFRDEAGDLCAWKAPTFPTLGAALVFAESRGAKVAPAVLKLSDIANDLTACGNALAELMAELRTSLPAPGSAMHARIVEVQAAIEHHYEELNAAGIKVELPKSARAASLLA